MSSHGVFLQRIRLGKQQSQSCCFASVFLLEIDLVGRGKSKDRGSKPSAQESGTVVRLKSTQDVLEEIADLRAFLSGRRLLNLRSVVISPETFKEN